MNNDKPDTRDKAAQYVTRDAILKLLSDDELARVSTAETAKSLADGDEYIDLEHLEQGVRTAGKSPAAIRRALPRKAVAAATWGRILTQLPKA